MSGREVFPPIQSTNDDKCLFLPNLLIRKSPDGYTTDDLVFLWKEGDPVQVTSKLNLSRFTLLKFLTDYCTSRTNTG